MGTATAVFLAVAAAIACALAAYHIVNVTKLRRWLSHPRRSAVPEAPGVWDKVFADLYRHERDHTRARRRLVHLVVGATQAGRAMPDGVVILDRNNRVEWCNVRAQKYLGVDRRVDVGRPIVNLVRDPAFVRYVETDDFPDNVRLRPARNPSLALSMKLIPYGQHRKLLLCRDVTQEEKVEIMRRDFVANVSHELKTPLTVVSGFLETIADGAVDLRAERGRRVVALMSNQTERMLRLIADLLTLSELEASATPASEAYIDVQAWLESVLADAQVLSAGRHVIALSVEAPALLYGNEQELRSAVGNLVSNAIRYTPEGGRIALSWRERNGEGVFSVEDSGIGLEAQHIPRITERFYRVDTSRSRDTGGTGLGLAIVKHVLTRHQARLEVASEIGRGSRFSAVMPARRVRLLTDRRAAETALQGVA